MINRILFTLKNVLAKRENLRLFVKDPALSCSRVLDISPQLLRNKEIAILVLDFDGVLAPHNGPKLLPDVFNWLKDLELNWPCPIYIFSNKPLPEREAYFQVHFPKVGFIKNVARKPFPDGLLQLQKESQIPGRQILMVDDRLLTGILAALLAETQALWIKKPYQNFKVHPFKETWFHLLRIMDRLLLQ